MTYVGTYCSDTDLLIGDVTLKNHDVLTRKHIDGGATEIEARIGMIYPTPVNTANVSRAGWLLLKTICIHIASGRLLMEIDQAGEGTKVHDYALYLLQQADAALDSIVKGDVDLHPSGASDEVNTTRGKVVVNNIDPYSQVEAFMGWAAQPPPFYVNRGFYPYGR